MTAGLSQLLNLLVALSTIAIAAPAASARFQVSSDRASTQQASQKAAKPKKPVSPRDSLWTLRTAQNRLQVHQNRVSLFAEVDRRPAAFKCEKAVPPFCYGPENGGLVFGLSEGFGLPLLFRTAPGYVEKRLEKRMDALVRYLMGELDKSFAKIPGDRWLVGQRIYHVVDHGELERAQKMARECVSDRWWCASLVGFTSYLLNQMERADSAFAAALELMPDAERCKWEDVSDLLYEDKGRGAYLNLSCVERKEVNRNFWWLSDPLYVTPGNERMAAHYFRVVFRDLFRASVDAMPPFLRSTIYPPPPRTPRAAVYGAELWLQGAVPSIIRNLGVPSNVVQELRVPGDDSPLEMLLVYDQPTYSFIPDFTAVANPLRAQAAAWNLENPLAVERFHPAYGVFRTLDYQIAFFRRGDSARVVAATDITRDSVLVRAGHQLLNAALVMSKRPDDVRIARDTVPGTSVTFDSRTTTDSLLFSIEALASGIGAGRVRFASGPTPMPRQRVSMSDLLLLRSGNSLPTSLDQAVLSALPSTTVAAQTADLFWEVYGLEAGDSVSYSLSATETSRGIVTRLSRLIGVGAREEGSSVHWGERISSGQPIAPRAITLDISGFPAGTHRIALEILVPGQQAVRVQREITIRRKS